MKYNSLRKRYLLLSIQLWFLIQIVIFSYLFSIYLITNKVKYQNAYWLLYFCFCGSLVYIPLFIFYLEFMVFLLICDSCLDFKDITPFLVLFITNNFPISVAWLLFLFIWHEKALHFYLVKFIYPCCPLKLCLSLLCIKYIHIFFQAKLS